MRRLLILAVADVLGAVVPASPGLAAPGPSFTNPLVGTPNSADPLDRVQRQLMDEKTTPIFQRSDVNGVHGPGRASSVRSPDNAETWVVHHANSSAGQGCGTTRTTRAQKINWNSDGSPDLGVPVRTGTSIAGPSGDS
ncbi:family 43 glycosylhydrolase [Nonomuraea turkmeniaca]|uniref:family 43 glycosylhydrolase n=1 Tax=Nonomuraea turkmeniaca TaxID=103838 RepID=UPI001B85F30B|nr:family 43 glycosylhydrolase [Nonomuraea turkmeniaca]